MRNQNNRTQRNFVVEYKSSRRQPREGAKSIWADADLRALSKAVIDDMPLPVSAGQVESADEIDRQFARGEGQPFEAVPMAATEAEQSAEMQSLEPTATLAEPVGSSRPARIVRKKRGKRPGSLRIASVQVNETELSVASATSVAVEAMDPLASLESENRRLKYLLIDKLRGENDRLREMLRRFGPM